MLKAIVFSQVKQGVDYWIEKYGQEDMPPPFQFFTMKNNAGVGNQHLVQKVFEGPFEFDIIYSSGSSQKQMNCKRHFMLNLDSN